MIRDLSKARIYIRPGVTDMRKAINGLLIIVQHCIKLDPFGDSIFLFCNRKRDRIKILYWDRNGFCLWQKRLEKDRFPWPGTESEVMVFGPDRLLKGSRVSEATLACVMTSKFCDGLPFYRLSRILERYKVKISRGTMCNWTIRVHQRLKSYYSVQKEKLLACPAIGIDETRLRVLNIDGENNKKQCYMWYLFCHFPRYELDEEIENILPSNVSVDDLRTFEF